jgi:hypothetical protein
MVVNLQSLVPDLDRRGTPWSDGDWEQVAPTKACLLDGRCIGLIP